MIKSHRNDRWFCLLTVTLCTCWLHGCTRPDDAESPDRSAARVDAESAGAAVTAETVAASTPRALATHVANRAWRDQRLGGHLGLGERLGGGLVTDDGVIPGDDNSGEPSILMGTATIDYDAVGYLISTRFGRGRCTGTLVSCKAVLTAAHCFVDHNGVNVQPSDYKLYFQHAGLTDVESIHRYCDSRANCDPVIDDLAIVILRDRPSVVPYKLVDPNTWPQSTVVVGFGVTGEDSDRGVKRYGPVEPKPCAVAENCIDITGDHANCAADSGGPLLVETGDSHQVAGIARETLAGGDCKVAQGRYLNMSHSAYSQWAGSVIEDNACEELESPQFAPAQVLDEISRPLASSLQPVTLQAGTAGAQANLNFQVGLGNDFSLDVPAGATCEKTGEAVSCKLPGPYVNDQQVSVKRNDSLTQEAFYQLTVVTH